MKGQPESPPRGACLGDLCKRSHDHEGTGKSLRYRDGRGHCVECQKINASDSYRRNVERRDAQVKQWKAKNTEKVKEYSRRSNSRWRSKNKDHVQEYSREYYEKNRDTLRAKRQSRRGEREAARAWIERHPERIAEAAKRWLAENPEKAARLKKGER